MPKSLEATIAQVRKGSLAFQAGVREGDLLLSVNGRRPRDYIAYRYLIAVESISLKLRRAEGGSLMVHIEKGADEDPGLRFSSDVFDRVITCRCRCEFCFVSQLPPGLRPSLYLRDDDYRLSFLQGNFITLSNLTEADFRRLLSQRLSPLWVSVHASDSQVRARLMGGKSLPDILAQMKRLADGGIEFHAQVVVCPGWNDGPVLEKTVRDLAALHPAVKSVGVVPAGINLALAAERGLHPVGEALARQILHQVKGWQKEFLRRLGTRLVWASDEMHLLAGREFPPAAEYEEFLQRANGIGEARLFLEEVEAAEFKRILREKMPLLRKKPMRLVLGTGAAASGLAAQMAARLNEVGLKANVVAAANHLFGPTVTSAGLIAGADWLEALGKAPQADLVLLPRQTLNFEGLFLDDVSRREFARRLGAPVAFARAPLEAAALIAKQCDKISME